MFITYHLDGNLAQKITSLSKNLRLAMTHQTCWGLEVSQGSGCSSIWCEKRHSWSLEHVAACAAADGFVISDAVSQPPATPPNAISV